MMVSFKTCLFYSQSQRFLWYLCTFWVEENKRLSTRSGYCQRCTCVVCMTSAISWPNRVFVVANKTQFRGIFYFHYLPKLYFGFNLIIFCSEQGQGAQSPSTAERCRPQVFHVPGRAGRSWRQPVIADRDQDKESEPGQEGMPCVPPALLPLHGNYSFPVRTRDYATYGSCHLVHAVRSAQAPRLLQR